MADAVADEDLLLALLNSTPVVDGQPTDELADPGPARARLAGLGGVGSEAERRHVSRRVRCCRRWCVASVPRTR